MSHEKCFSYFEKHLPLNEDTKKLLASCMEYVEFYKDDIIIDENIPNKYAYIIQSGIVKSCAITGIGDEVVYSIYCEQELFGYDSTYRINHFGSKQFIALENVKTFKINLELFRSFFAINLEVCNLGRLIAESSNLINEHYHFNLRLNNAEDRVNFLMIYRPGIFERIKLKDIASLIDIRPETLSRIRRHKLFARN